MIYGLSISQFKNVLVKNKWQAYQDAFEKSDPTINYKEWTTHKTFKYQTCPDYRCFRSKQYHKCNMKYITYDAVKNINKNKPLDQMKIKEEAWSFNQHDFFINDNLLTLNNIPMQFIKRRCIMKPERACNCYSTYFIFNISPYCDMINYILKCKKYKYILFYYLPNELIRTILHLTSLFV